MFVLTLDDITVSFYLFKGSHTKKYVGFLKKVLFYFNFECLCVGVCMGVPACGGRVRNPSGDGGTGEC